MFLLGTPGLVVRHKPTDEGVIIVGVHTDTQMALVEMYDGHYWVAVWELEAL